MDDRMYIVMRFDWNTQNPDNWGGDSVLAVSMTMEGANAFLSGWIPESWEKLTENTSRARVDAMGGRWRIFEGENGKRSTLRIDSALLV